MGPNAKKIGGSVKSRRLAVGLTQAQLAERAGLDTIYISQIERGKRLMSLETLYRVSAAVRVSPSNLLDDKGGRDDALVHELRDILDKWKPRQRKAVLAALRALAEV